MDLIGRLERSYLNITRELLRIALRMVGTRAKRRDKLRWAVLDPLLESVGLGTAVTFIPMGVAVAMSGLVGLSFIPVALATANVSSELQGVLADMMLLFMLLPLVCCLIWWSYVILLKMMGRLSERFSEDSSMDHILLAMTLLSFTMTSGLVLLLT